MTPSDISKRVVTDRLAWIRRMLGEIRQLPLEAREQFFADRRNLWTAESCLRRALEALLDLGRHVLAKGFASGVTEYKDIAEQSQRHGILSRQEADLLRVLAGYRNRLVHFYHEIEPDELYQVCASHLGDVEKIAQAYENWLEENPERLDRSL